MERHQPILAQRMVAKGNKETVETSKWGQGTARQRYGSLDYETRPPAPAKDLSAPQRLGDSNNLRGPSNDVSPNSWLRGGGERGCHPTLTEEANADETRAHSSADFSGPVSSPCCPCEGDRHGAQQGIWPCCEGDWRYQRFILERQGVALVGRASTEKEVECGAQPRITINGMEPATLYELNLEVERQPAADDRIHGEIAKRNPEMEADWFVTDRLIDEALAAQEKFIAELQSIAAKAEQ
jgi:hypothetical protein